MKVGLSIVGDQKVWKRRFPGDFSQLAGSAKLFLHGEPAPYACHPVMPAHSKYTEVMSVIKRRIREGDYLLSKFPGERKIAEETGVSYMTARRAITQLLDDKVLVRGPSGGLDVHPSYAKRAKPAQVVLL